MQKLKRFRGVICKFKLKYKTVGDKTSFVYLLSIVIFGKKLVMDVLRTIKMEKLSHQRLIFFFAVILNFYL